MNPNRQLLGALIVAVCAIPTDGVLARYDFEKPPADRWELPNGLDEVSGLATDSPDRLFAHGDERAEIFELDRTGHRILSRFIFGDPAARSDFEGIAVAEERLFLVNSDGVLYAGRRGLNGERVPFVTYATGLGSLCEVEGVAYDPTGPSLLLVCKEARTARLRNRLAIFRWSIDRRTLFPNPAVLIDARPIARMAGQKSLHPSEITRDPGTGHLLVLAGRERVLIELTPDGQVVHVSRLRRSLHRQPEGLGITLDGSLLIADEAAGKHATLTTYARVE